MRPKSDFFTKDIECIMIEMVKQCPLLWDTTLEQYRRTDLKRMHWDKIAQHLGPKFTGDMVCKRFQNMESTFRANERKIKKSKTSGKGTDDIYKPKWEYYDMLLFLRKTCTQSESIDNVSLQNHISVCSETVDCSPVLSPCSDVQNTSKVTNIYYDENTKPYMVIPSDLYEYNNTASTNSGQTSPSVQSEFSSDAASVATTSTSIDQLATSDISNTSHLSSQIVTAPTSVLAPLNTKRSAEDSLYVKRGTSKKSKILEDAVNAIKNMAQENMSPPKMDTFDMLGAYIASRLRTMTPNDQEYYEREILKVLTQYYKQ